MMVAVLQEKAATILERLCPTTNLLIENALPVCTKTKKTSKMICELHGSWGVRCFAIFNRARCFYKERTMLSLFPTAGFGQFPFSPPLIFGVPHYGISRSALVPITPAALFLIPKSRLLLKLFVNTPKRFRRSYLYRVAEKQTKTPMAPWQSQPLEFVFLLHVSSPRSPSKQGIHCGHRTNRQKEG